MLWSRRLKRHRGLPSPLSFLFKKQGRPYQAMDGFFFSSRRRHTRFDCDWSSDVCSSDLLRGGAGEAVEDGAFLGVGLRQFRLDEAEDHAVGDELAVVHVLLRFAAERGAVLHGGAQDVARGDLGKAETLRENLTLGALARA